MIFTGCVESAEQIQNMPGKQPTEENNYTEVQQKGEKYFYLH